MSELEVDQQPARRRRGDEALIAALAAGHTYPEAGKIARVSLRTVHRRMAEPLFRAEVDARRREVASQVTASLVDAATAAVGRLKAQLQSQEPWLAQKAAIAILEYSTRRFEGELEAELAALREEAQELRGALAYDDE